MSDNDNEKTMLVTLTKADLAHLVDGAVRKAVRAVAAELSDPMLKTPAASKYTGRSERAIRNAVAAGGLVPDDRVSRGGRGRSHGFRRSTLDAWIRAMAEGRRRAG